MEILLSGSLAIDRIMDFPGHFKDHLLPEKLHALNISFNIERLEERRGGSASNIAYTLALLGEKPRIIAAAGNDFALYLDYLQGLGLPTDGIEIHDDLTTASANIITDRDDNQITGFFVGAMERQTQADLSKYDPAETLLVLSPGNTGDMLRYANDAKRLGIKTIFDPGQSIPSLTPDELRTLIDGSFMLIVSDYELLMIMKRTGLTEAEINQQVEFLITTYGKDGSTITFQDATVRIPSGNVAEAKDPTGAGHAYRAGLIKGLAEELDMDQVGRVAATAASYAVEHYGTQEHYFTIDAFCERYKAQFSETCPLSPMVQG